MVMRAHRCIGAADSIEPNAIPAELVPSVCTNWRLLDFNAFQILLAGLLDFRLCGLGSNNCVSRRGLAALDLAA